MSKRRKKPRRVPRNPAASQAPITPSPVVTPVSHETLPPEGKKPEELIIGTILVIGSMMWADYFLPKDWMYAWSQEQTPAWAKAIFLWAGAIASLTFIHACITTETALIARKFSRDECYVARSIYRVAGACVAGGAFCGLLFTFISAARLPANIKLTALASDLAMAGTVVGLAAAAPFFIFHTWKAIIRLLFSSKRKFFEVTLVLTIFDTWILDRLLRLLPKDMGFLGYILSFI